MNRLEDKREEERDIKEGDELLVKYEALIVFPKWILGPKCNTTVYLK